MLAIDPAAAYLGTVVALASELLVVTGVVVVVSGLLFHFSFTSLLIASPSVALTVVDLTLLGVLFGALAARPGQSAALLPLIALPSFTPVVIAGERLLGAAVTHHAAGQWWGLLILMSAVYGGIGVLLYGVIGEL
jgi:ABC-type transport system involved in cytochrome c biogenesis permease component